MEKSQTVNQEKLASSAFSSDADRTERKLHFVWDECQPSEMDKGHVWAKTAEKIREYEAQVTVRRTRLRRRWLTRVLCGAAALWVLWWGGRAFYRWQQESLPFLSEPFEADDVVCLDKDDAVRLVLLPDSTRMWVNEDSRVVYPRAFAQGRREIFVEGEVYLEVTRDEARPFVVRTDDFVVEVLGTSFDVKAYHGSPDAVTLLEGSVRVEDAHRQTVVMQPNERLEVTGSGLGKKEQVDAQAYVRWAHKVWVLEGEPLREVLHDVGEFYGVEITCDSLVGAEPFYGKLYVGSDVSQVLDAIRLTLPDDLRADEAVFRIKPRN